MPPQQRPLIRVGNRMVPGPPVVNPNLRSLLDPNADITIAPDTLQANVSALQPAVQEPDVPRPKILDLVSQLFSDASDRSLSENLGTVVDMGKAYLGAELDKGRRLVDTAKNFNLNDAMRDLAQGASEIPGEQWGSAALTFGEGVGVPRIPLTNAEGQPLSQHQGLEWGALAAGAFLPIGPSGRAKLVGEVVDKVGDAAKALRGPAATKAVLGGIKKVKPAGITGLDESAVKLITDLFPKLDTHNKNTAFITPKAAERKLRAAGADDTVIAKVQEWFDARKLRPAAPGELPTVAQGEVYTSTGRTTRRAVNPAEVEGQIQGAPLGVTSTRHERELRKKYIQALEEGKSGRFFYDDSGASIAEHASGDPVTARQFTRGIAVTSPQTPVPTNTDFAIKGHNQAIAGVPVKTGKYPGEMGEAIDAVYQGGDNPLGPKREPFMEQIAEPGGYRGNTGPIRPVNDIWQGELFGYINPDGTPKREGFSPAQHAWMDKQMDLAIREAIEKQVGGVINWNTGNAQAAGWAAAKIQAGDIKLEEAAQAYHTFLDRAHMVMSRDNFPGEASGHLAGLSSAPREVQEEFAQGIRKVLYDEKGKDVSYKGARMLQDTGTHGEGIWSEGGTIYELPGNQIRIAVGQQKRGVTQRAMNDPFIQEALKDGSLVIEAQPDTNMRVIRNKSMDKEVFSEKVAPKLDQAIDDASLGLAQAIESQMGLLTGASAIAGTKVNPNVTVKLFNTVDIILPEATMQRGGAFLSDPRIQALIKTGNVVPIPLVDGVRLKNVGMGSNGVTNKALKDPFVQDAIKKGVLVIEDNPHAGMQVIRNVSMDDKVFSEKVAPMLQSEFAGVVAQLAKPQKVRGPKKGEYGTAAGELAPPYRMSQEGQDQGFFAMNNWADDAGKIGQAYIQAIDNPDLPNSIAIFNKTAPARAKGLAEFYRAFSQKYGYPLSAVLMDLNDHVAEHGFDGIKMVAKKYGVDLSKLGVLMATIALIQDQKWGES